MGILTRNWHLKLGAVFLATVLYTGLVYSGSFTEASVAGIPVTPVNQPDQPQTVLMSQLPIVDVQYRVSRDRADIVTADTFAATVDLSQYDLEQPGQPQSLPIQVRSLVDGVDVLEYEPSVVTVRLDEFASREVPVRVDLGDVPDGLSVGTPRVSPSRVNIRGPSSVVSRIDHARARIQVDPSGIDFLDTPVDLEPVDVDGLLVSGRIEIDPPTVSVNVDVQTVQTNKTVSVRPDLQGTPAAGFAVAEVVVEPSVLTLRGDPDDLRSVTEVVTEPLSVDGADGALTFDAALVLPDGVRLVEPDEPTVSVSVGVVQIASSRTLVVGLVCQGAPAGSACLPGVEQVSVTLSGPIGTLGALEPGDLTPILDVSGLGPGQHDVSPTLALPEGVSLLAISPVQVPVTIVPPATPSPSPAPA